MGGQGFGFGLSKVCTTTMSKIHISTTVKGSFGIVRKTSCGACSGEEANELAEWTKSCHRDGELDQIIDPNMKGEIETDNYGERNDDEAFASVPGCAMNESVQCISETIFSEINDPNGR
ncbi:hypothetical protein DVH24_006203 [Malus domestica]|uniref:Uncharacterized protein n=1 Tax=Malus domestica TaxID=3750 RepID=A0A498KPS5_MALDO|nr:hypothetical protein DVH24_006203 [Malus domestica]